jgi:hypothetical protein
MRERIKKINSFVNGIKKTCWNYMDTFLNYPKSNKHKNIWQQDHSRVKGTPCRKRHHQYTILLQYETNIFLNSPPEKFGKSPCNSAWSQTCFVYSRTQILHSCILHFQQCWYGPGQMPIRTMFPTFYTTGRRYP